MDKTLASAVNLLHAGLCQALVTSRQVVYEDDHRVTLVCVTL